MKLAEALVQRADVQKRIAQLGPRLQQSSMVQEGEQPPEDPQELLKELDQLLNQLQGLITRINKTNLRTNMPDGSSLTDALALRDVLSTRQSMLSDLANTAANRVDRYGRSEIRKLPTVDVAALRRTADEVARQRRELDTTLQGLNWTTDLVE